MAYRSEGKDILDIVEMHLDLQATNGNNGVEVEMRKDRLIVGLLCIAFAVWTFLSDNTIGPAIGIGVLGLITVAIARKK